MLKYSSNTRQCLGGQTYNKPNINKHLKILKCLPNTYSAGVLFCPNLPIGLIVRDYFKSSLNAITTLFCLSSTIVTYIV